MRWRSIVAAFLTAGGLTVAAFYTFLFGMADCAAGCVARGEQAVVIALVGVGIGMFGAGVLLRRDPPRALAVGLLAAGVSASAGIAYNMAQGARGIAIALLAVALATAVLGAWLWWRQRERAAG